MNNYLGTFIGFSINLFYLTSPSLLMRILSQIGGIIGGQFIPVLLMIIPKLNVKNVTIKFKHAGTKAIIAKT